MGTGFPFLFGGAFIEGPLTRCRRLEKRNFPSFSEGLSLRVSSIPRREVWSVNFPSFSEGLSLRERVALSHVTVGLDFPSFSEGLS